MANSLETTDFTMTEEFARENLEKITKKTTTSEINNCILYTGREDKHGYGVVDIKLPGTTRHRPMNVHRITYMIHVRLTKLSPSHFHVSHLCHSKKCVNIKHLSFEPPHINNARQNCYSEKRCTSHDQYQDCLL